jgi:hypothetical protein
LLFKKKIFSDIWSKVDPTLVVLRGILKGYLKEEELPIYVILTSFLTEMQGCRKGKELQGKLQDYFRHYSPPPPGPHSVPQLFFPNMQKSLPRKSQKPINSTQYISV